MKYLRYGLIALGLLFASQAEAATCFWVGGTGTWDTTTTTHWASSTGGTASTCAATGGIPKNAGDIATFDGSSGGGTVTVDSTMNGTTIGAITAGAFTGTLDFSVNNPSMTLNSGATAISFSGAGTGRVFKLGSGTFTMSVGGGFDFTTTTGAGTQSMASATLVFNGNSVLAGQQSIAMGGLSYGTITINGRTSGQGVNLNGNVNGASVSTLNMNGKSFITIGSTTVTMTNLNITGAASNLVAISINSQNTQASWTVTTATITYATIRNIAFVNPTTASNSWDMGANSNLTATPPSGGGGGHIIGG